MQPARRHRYLQALGVQSWRLRDAEPLTAEQPSTAEPEQASPQVFESAIPAPLEGPAPAAPWEVPDAATPESPRVLADAADLSGLQAQVAGCQACKLCSTRTQTVFGVGPSRAPLMLVGEGPGAEEDARGEPFVGRAGKLLDEMLRAIGRSRAQDTYIANVVKCRPPGNRDPDREEVEACRPYLDQQIRLIQPRLIVGLGRVAAQRLLRSDQPLSRLRGPLHHYGPEATPVLMTYHPSYLLRSPREKAKSWEDLKRIGQFLRKSA